MSNKQQLRAASLHQPWADLIALGHKTIETRGWSTSYRGPLLICSAKRYDKLARLITSKYQHAGPHPQSCFARPLFGPNYQPQLGMALAVANLVDVRPMVASDRRAAGFFKDWCVADKFSWMLEDIQPIVPISIKGMQRLFDPTKQGITLATIETLQLTLFQEAA